MGLLSKTGLFKKKKEEAPKYEALASDPGDRASRASETTADSIAEPAETTKPSEPAVVPEVKEAEGRGEDSKEAKVEAPEEPPRIPELTKEPKEIAVVRKDSDSPAREPLTKGSQGSMNSSMKMLAGAGAVTIAALLMLLLLGLLPASIQTPFNTLLGRPAFGSHVSSAPIMHYYMYRVQNDEDYSPENQNMANIPGALWYLHNEIVWHHWLRSGTFAATPKTRIERFLVFSRASQELYNKGMNFGVVNAYDLGKCTGPFRCENLKEYGPVVGCESWDPKQRNNFPHGQWTGTNVYPHAVWYSLPGKCSSKKFWDQKGSCVQDEPSGACPLGVVPTGEWTCTYTYQKVGELRISDIENISSLETFLEGGGREYDKEKDKGVKMHFWDNIHDPVACQKRVDKVKRMFEAKYPDQPVLEDPSCDFSVGKFYPYYPDGTFDAPAARNATNASVDTASNANISNATRVLVTASKASGFLPRAKAI